MATGFGAYGFRPVTAINHDRPPVDQMAPPRRRCLSPGQHHFLQIGFSIVFAGRLVGSLYWQCWLHVGGRIKGVGLGFFGRVFWLFFGFFFWGDLRSVIWGRRNEVRLQATLAKLNAN